MTSPLPSNAPASGAGRTPLLWGALFFGALALFSASENPWQSAITGKPIGSPFGRVLFYYCVHWAIWGALAVGVARLARRFPPVWRRPASWLFHLGAAVAVSVFQLVAMRLTIHGMLALFEPSSPIGPALVRDFQMFAHQNLLTYAAIVAATLGFEAERRARAQAVRSARLAEQLAQAELAALRMQLHPHFLFNSLQTAAELVHENPEAAERSILGLSDLLRRALRAAERSAVPLADELEFVDGYLALEAVRFEGKLAIELRAPEELLATPVPSLILQPLVENAIRHGIARRSSGGTIAIEASRSGDRLLLAVENDLPHPGAGGARTGTGIGLANVRARLEHLHGADARLATGTTPRGRYRAAIELPLTAPARVEPRALPLLEGASR